MSDKKVTRIWRHKNGEQVLVKALPSLIAFPIKIGQKCNIPGYGQTVCSGIKETGSGESKQVIEIDLIIVGL